MKPKSLSVPELIKEEGWQIIKTPSGLKILAYNQEFPITHPFFIHSKFYREETNPQIKYDHFKRMNDLLWPNEIFHSWTETRYRAHCDRWKCITYAGGASCAKSRDAAKIAVLFWLSDPTNNAVIIASTTLSSLTARIGGYVVTLLREKSFEIPYNYMRSQPPRIMYNRDDAQHGIFFVSAKQGDDDTAIKDLIGRHPKKRMMIVLDESTDMNPSLLGALPNLQSGLEWFQLYAIGNSNSKFDLHGALSTPKNNNWESINPLEQSQWETTQPDGLCLYFSPFESPAIHESDPIKKKILGRFLITESQLKEKEKIYGKDSEAFYRFVLGYWKSSKSDNLMMSSPFLEPKRIYEKAHWLGAEPLIVVAGIDPAFSSGGDLCVLRLGFLGQDIEGNILLDFRGEELLFKINISATSGDSAEIQIAKQTIAILNKYGCPLHHLVIDASGQGRALGGTLQLYANSVRAPIKIYNVRTGNQKDKSFDVVPKTRHELWFDVRNYIEAGSIRGVDSVALSQLSSRLIIRNDKTGKQELESKGDYKKRMGAIMPSLAHSPDEADAMALCLQSAILNFGFYPGQTREVPKLEPGVLQEIAAWKSNVKQIQEDYMRGVPAGQPAANFAVDTVKKWGTL